MKSINDLLNIPGKNNLFFILAITLLLGVGCKQPEKQPKESTNVQKSEESTNQQNVNTMEEQSTEKEGVGSEGENKTEAANGESENEIVATVNGNPIYKNDLRGRDLDTVIDDEIFYLEGINRGYDQKFAKQVEAYKRNLITSAVKRQAFNEIPKQEATEEEMKDYYQKNENNYTFLKVKQLTLNDEDTADQIKNQLTQGQTVEDIVKEYKDKGVNVSVSERRIPTTYNKFFSKLEVGSTSEVRKGDNGFYVMTITDIKKIPFEKTKASVRDAVIALKRGKAMDDIAQKYQKDNNIEVKIMKDN